MDANVWDIRGVFFLITFQETEYLTTSSLEVITRWLQKVSKGLDGQQNMRRQTFHVVSRAEWN